MADPTILASEPTPSGLLSTAHVASLMDTPNPEIQPQSPSAELPF